MRLRAIALTSMALACLVSQGCCPCPPKLRVRPTGAARATPSRGVLKLHWLTGCWVGKAPTSTVRECWLPPRAGMMFGYNQVTVVAVKAGRQRTVFFEELRIVERGGSLVYVARPKGRGTTDFKLREAIHQRVVFENPAHDYPSRITYYRVGTALHVRLEGVEGGKPKTASFTWQRVGN